MSEHRETIEIKMSPVEKILFDRTIKSTLKFHHCVNVNQNLDANSNCKSFFNKMFKNSFAFHLAGIDSQRFNHEKTDIILEISPSEKKLFDQMMNLRKNVVKCMDDANGDISKCMKLFEELNNSTCSFNLKRINNVLVEFSEKDNIK